jgi:RNA polymerase sigma factor (TIGR02999 family)
MIPMTDVTQILNAIQQGDPKASEELLPLVYEELRVLARQRLANEKPGQTLQATALVHEAYLRLVGKENDASWDNRGHFFAAAAEVMRRILVEVARHKATHKMGGDRQREELAEHAIPPEFENVDLIALDEALAEFELKYPEHAQLIKLRYFAAFSLEVAADMLGLSRATAQRKWAFSRAWLVGRLSGE